MKEFIVFGNVVSYVSMIVQAIDEEDALNKASYEVASNNVDVSRLELVSVNRERVHTLSVNGVDIEWDDVNEVYKNKK